MQQKCIYVSVAGPTNAGKSTFINFLVGSKISIVTPKPQTTRYNLRGIVNHKNTQIILLDTPGLFAPSRHFDNMLLKSAFQGVREGEIILVMIDARVGLRDEKLLELLAGLDKRAILVINKIDLVRNKERLLQISEQANALFNFEQTFMVSARTGDGALDVRQYLIDIAPQARWLYPPDHLTDATMRFTAEEITREKLFLQLRQELPYYLTVKTDKWQEEEKSVKIHQTIYVARKSHKTIVVGKGGRQIRSIGEDARSEIGQILEKTAHLFLYVKVHCLELQKELK
ncbi:GTPase Era [Rickettsiales bacterium]|nr:GTPase Era [Rickettsiales bacterium]